MATNYITAEPCSIEDFLAEAKKDGFTYDPMERSLIHTDGRGCFGLSEETHWVGDQEEGWTYVGCMNDPELNNIEMVAEGSDEYEEICADERDEDDEDSSANDR